MTDTVLRTRNADGRNYYQAPCCQVNIGIIEEAVRADCPACGAVLCQLTDTLSVYRKSAKADASA